MKKFIEFLRNKRASIVREVKVLEPRWNPTYGQQDPSEMTLEVIDFDRLLEEMEDFENTFKTETA